MKESAISAASGPAAGVYAPGHLGELTQIVDVDLVDAVLAETGAVQRRVRLLPSRVVVFFVLALALFSSAGYRQVWAKLVAGLGGPVVVPSVSALSRARRRVGPAPLRALFEAVAGPVGSPGTPGVCWRGLRVVAVDGTLLQVPTGEAVEVVYRRRRGPRFEWGYPMLRLCVLAECGTRALLGAAFGPDTVGETGYVQRLLHLLTPKMLLLADAYFDSGPLLGEVSRRGAAWLCRSTATRRPLIMAELPDRSYLTVITTGQGLLKVRIIEAHLAVVYADGTVRTESWRLITSLLDHRRHPAADLVELYHQRWEVETTFRGLKCTIGGNRVLRSRTAPEIDQEVWAVLTVYQTLTRVINDALHTRPGTDPDQASLTTALETARDQVITAAAVQPGHHPLLGPIGNAVLATLHPPRRRRAKARTKKLRTSKYRSAGTGLPARTLPYELHTEIMIFEQGLTPRPSP